MTYLGMIVLFVSGVFFGSSISNSFSSLAHRRFSALLWTVIACLGVAFVMGGRL